MAKYKNTEIFACPVAEGVRFQLGNSTVFAVRRQNKDVSVRIRRERHPFRKFWEQVPFVRGIVRLFVILFGFLDSLMESGEMEPGDAPCAGGFERWLARIFHARANAVYAFFRCLLVAAVMLFAMVGLPWLLDKHVLCAVPMSRGLVNAIVTIVRIAGLFASVFMITRLKLMRRLCMYQGAINKVLNAYEYEGKELTFADAMEESPYHPRSDAVFVLLVCALAMIAPIFLRTYTLHIQILVRVLSVMAIAALVNEPLHFLENSDPDRPLNHALLVPVYKLQRIFVAEPTGKMVELAMSAFRTVRENDVW